MWRRDPSYLQLVKDSRGDANSIRDMNQLQSVLNRMQVSFQEWERDVFGSVNQELARLRRDLEDERRRSFLVGPSR
jgi:hypothetical protein